jgi:7-carboxy-7-deazaguanine synthase|tara:strand:+ start:4500 stop:5399 length:900 start_codon:yes stop_codon:yes gene_type:complete
VINKEYLYSEIFDSIQGEGTYTGVHTLWLRFFMCNLQCNGFGQIDPTKPETYELPFQEYDLSKVKRVEDLPVWDKGCDSSYTWSKRFKHLMSKGTPKQIAERIIDTAKTDTNPDGLFKHPISKQKSDMCFTGGEPLTANGQTASINILKYFNDIINLPRSVTYETNGTRVINNDFIEFWKNTNYYELFFSVSPKLWTVAGEPRQKAILPEVVATYYKLSTKGHLKFVLGSKQEQWDEMEEVLQMYRDVGIDYPVYIMPVGAREEEQVESAGKIAEMAYKRGYNVSARVHVYLFGNAIGT